MTSLAIEKTADFFGGKNFRVRPEEWSQIEFWFHLTKSTFLNDKNLKGGLQYDYMGVSKNKGTQKLMIYNGKPY